MRREEVLLIFGFFLAVFSYVDACKGCLNLDEYSFDKVLPRFEAVLVKFDVAYPYGEKHDLFGKLAGETINNRNFVLATVGVKDYGEKDNAELAKKFNINSKDDLPALRLFVQGEDEPFTFEKSNVWNEENLKKFVRDHTNIYLGLPGCLEEFDKLAMKFTAAADKEKVLRSAEQAIDKLQSQREKDIASTYIKFMKKVLESGASFVFQESARLEKILKEGKVNEKKKEELSHRANILKSFVVKSDKTEL